MPTSCKSSTDCGSNEMCVSEYCVPTTTCTQDSDCGTDYICDSGSCTLNKNAHVDGFSHNSSKCSYPGNVFGTCLYSNDAKTGRLIATVVFGLIVFVMLVFTGIYTWKQMAEQNTEKGRVAFAVFFGLLIAAATFISLELTAFNVSKDYLYAVIAFSVVIAIALCVMIYARYAKNQELVYNSGSFALFAEFLVLIIMIVSPNFAGQKGILTQSALLTPLIASTIGGLFYSSQ